MSPTPIPLVYPNSESLRLSASATNGRTRWLAMLIAMLVIGCAVTADGPVANAVAQNNLSDEFHRVLSLAGMPGGKVGPWVVGFLLIPFANRRRLIIGLGTALIISGSILHLLKWAIGRARPTAWGTGASPFDFHPFNLTGDFDSFPSGHAMMAVLLALFLSRVAPHWRGPLLGLAIVAAATRIGLGRHYLTDVLAGAGLAWLALWLGRIVLGPSFYAAEQSEARETPRGAPVLSG